MKARGLIVAMVIGATAGGGAKEGVSMRVTPAFAFAPATLMVRTNVEPNSDNRSIEITADGDDFYRSSFMQLEGDRAPRTTVFEFRSLPPGTYEVTATVSGAGGRPRATTHSTVTVFESGTPR